MHKVIELNLTDKHSPFLIKNQMLNRTQITYLDLLSIILSGCHLIITTFVMWN